MSAREMLEWAAYLNMKAKGTKPDMSPDELMGAARHITRTSKAGRRRG